MFNDCEDGRAGSCVKTEHLTDVPDGRQCPRHRAVPADELGQRDVSGCYPATEIGKLAVDGSRLDHIVGQHVISRAWADPACERGQCLRPEIGRMVPLAYRYCPIHGRLQLPAVNPYPLDGPERRRAADAAWPKLAAQSGLLNRDHWASFDRVNRSSAVAAVHDFWTDHRYRTRAMVLAGGPGCGKTTALSCYVRESWVWRGPLIFGSKAEKIVFVPYPRLIGLLLNRDERDATIDACLEASRLIWDDMGSSYTKAGGMAAGLIEEIVVYREGQEFELLASTNLTKQEFRSMFGDRVYDRLRGDWGTWQNVDGPSLRKKRPSE
jgi:hypothetical protein